MARQSLLVGTLLLFASNFIAKALGFAYRIALVRVLGTEGVGITELMMPVYSLFLVLSTWGLPMAASRIIAREQAAGRPENVRRCFRLLMRLLVLLGGSATAALWLLAPSFTRCFLSDERVLPCLRILVPAVFLVALASAYRAYFQGIKQIAIIGFSQNVEQFVRVGLGLFLACYLLPFGMERAVTAVSVATVAGEAAGLLYILLRYRKQKRPAPPTATAPTDKKLMHELFAFGTPVTATRLLSSLIMMAQASLIPWALMQAGYDAHTATALYGRYSGVAMSLLQLPAIFTAALSVAILPAVAESSGETLSGRAEKALFASAAFAFPAMLLLHVYATELCGWIFGVPEAGEALRILSIGGVFLYQQSIIVSILQGLGRVRVLCLNLLLSGLCLIVGIVLLARQPYLGIKGAAVAAACSHLLACSLNLLYLRSRTPLRISLRRVLGQPFLAAAAAAAVLLFFRARPAIGLSAPLAALCSTIPAMLIYLLVLLALGGPALSLRQRFRRP